MAEMTPPPGSRGFVYVATGERYVAEACASAATLRAVMPSAAIALITDKAPAGGAPFFAAVIVRPDVQHRPIDKLLAWAAPFDRCVFLDTDTHVAGDLSGLFELLESFDLAATPETLRGLHYTLPGVPAAFGEFNTGVLAFRRTPAVAGFFQAWKSAYEQLHASHGFVSDQPAFRWAAFRSGIRLSPLPSEYHFIALTPNYAMWDVRLVHGRGNLAGLAAELNLRLGARAYVPGLGTIAHFQGHRQWLLQSARLLVRSLGVALGLFRAPPAARNHWTAEEKRLSSGRNETQP